MGIFQRPRLFRAALSVHAPRNHIRNSQESMTRTSSQCIACLLLTRRGGPLRESQGHLNMPKRPLLSLSSGLPRLGSLDASGGHPGQELVIQFGKGPSVASLHAPAESPDLLPGAKPCFQCNSGYTRGVFAPLGLLGPGRLCCRRRLGASTLLSRHGGFSLAFAGQFVELGQVVPLQTLPVARDDAQTADRLRGS